MTRMTTISWNGRRGSGTDVPVSTSVEEGVRQIALFMAMIHGDLLYEADCKARGVRPNVIGMGAAGAHHLHSTDPALWERFKGNAVDLLKNLHGTGEKGLPLDAPHDSRAFFTELHDFAHDLRHRA